MFLLGPPMAAQDVVNNKAKRNMLVCFAIIVWALCILGSFCGSFSNHPIVMP